MWSPDQRRQNYLETYRDGNSSRLRTLGGTQVHVIYSLGCFWLNPQTGLYETALGRVQP